MFHQDIKSKRNYVTSNHHQSDYAKVNLDYDITDYILAMELACCTWRSTVEIIVNLLGYAFSYTHNFSYTKLGIYCGYLDHNNYDHKLKVYILASWNAQRLVWCLQLASIFSHNDHGTMKDSMNLIIDPSLGLPT